MLRSAPSWSCAFWIKLMSPEYVRPYVKAQKNDDRDAEAIAEAATRPTMRFVELKREDQLDLQTLHRVRERLVGTRTRLINQMRAILLERGLTFAKGRRKFEVGLDAILDAEGADVSDRINGLLIDMRQEWTELDRRITELDREFADRAKSDDVTRRLLTVPGIGNLTATALVAAIDDAAAFSTARDLPAWLGLVPRQHTTGGKPRLYGISRRGNIYLRQLFIHGARAALPSLSKAETPLGQWLRGLLARAHYNVAVVALAAKLARIAWATLERGTTFERSMPGLAEKRNRGLSTRHTKPKSLARSAGGVEDGLTVNRHSANLVKKCGSIEADMLMRNRVRGSPSWRRPTGRHAGYVFADRNQRQQKLLADGTGHTFFEKAKFKRLFGNDFLQVTRLSSQVWSSPGLVDGYGLRDSSPSAAVLS
ncbi:transposase for insertion sequence element A [Ruegeria lacuscaerulensis ITI-1157]|nr:transposase for insertion sequence element A [Ruegeria lacuscaerulensis ITI-1157]